MLRSIFAAIVFVSAVASSDAAQSAPRARTAAYDGSWSLTFNTKRGGCDAAYHFNVQINNGLVSHPNLVKFKGVVSRGGAVRASVSVPGKFASGAGRLTRTAGQGRWSGHAGKERCSGTWTAQKF